ncbi:unnamed protein product [Arabidopsis halleri]
MSIVVSLGTTLNLYRNLKNNPNDPNSVVIYPSSSRCFLEYLRVLFLFIQLLYLCFDSRSN